MKSATLMYHDVVERNRFEDSGFLETGANRYKIKRETFVAHLAAFQNAGMHTLTTFGQPDIDGDQERYFQLTFDDGGTNSLAIADILEDYGFRGHFFVPTDYIGKPRFVDPKDLKRMAARGHLVGSHSKSHPARMSQLDESRIICEWSESIDTLSQLLGHPVVTASVPNGRCSHLVAKCAAKAGIRHLFTSEPEVCSKRVDQCIISGRFTILRSTTSKDALDLVRGTGFARVRQYLSWNARKCLKCSGGSLYDSARHYLLRVPQR